ncbi:MAG: DNA gyrase/topoisomerase IV subunit A [Paludibacteraceae bacterium]|nr:DNA gyrase/topoisomerase IV subunit A [Paludibacteraceae bacterium]
MSHQLNTDEEEHFHLSGMFRNYFLDYASYTNLDRAIPHLDDGLKPVQRRVLHAMREKEDGRYNKVANIVGHTMQYHPHGDASITDALVNLGQKNILIDTQGNWGNILTGDAAAAARYIEARLSKFALEAVFNPKTTEWKPSYDGRNKEPISLPVKFPLLLAQGSEGIGTGLNTKILPHNFSELCDASIACLKDESFQIFPDFPTGGMLDVSKYEDGRRGGRLTIRARIEKIDNKTLKIVEVPYGVTTDDLIDSIVKAKEKGKLNIRKVDDLTAEHVEVVVALEPKTSSDKAIDALYAFSKCQVSYSPNCCVVDNHRPEFLSVSDVLRRNTERTKELLRRELEIARDELIDQLQLSSLERWFIFEERVYKDKEFENAKSNEIAIAHITKRLKPFLKQFIREIRQEDIEHLLELRMRRIIRFNVDENDEKIRQLQNKLKEIENNLAHLVEYAIDWFTHLKEKYASLYPRRTELRNFETIQAAKVAEANERLYINRTDGFIGIGLKKDDNNEFVCNCSNIDDIILFYRDGRYKIVRIADKIFVGKDVIHIAVFVRNDQRTIYNVCYRDGKGGKTYIKRFAVTGVIRDKEYNLTQGKPGSLVRYFTANPNGEAEIIRIKLKSNVSKLRVLAFDKDFSEIAIKGKDSMGNILAKYEVASIELKQEGVSTLGGTDIFFDPDILRLNTDRHGVYLGNFEGDDQILVIYKNGEYEITSFDLNNHYSDDIERIEKFEADKIWTAALFDGDQGFAYLKRFPLEQVKCRTSFLATEAESRLLLLTDTPYPHLRVNLDQSDKPREAIEIEASDFIGIKSFKARGKRLSNFSVTSVEELEPTHVPESKEETNETTTSVIDGVTIESHNTQTELNFDE